MKKCSQCSQLVKKTKTINGRQICNWCHRRIVNLNRLQAIEEELSVQL